MSPKKIIPRSQLPKRPSLYYPGTLQDYTTFFKQTENKAKQIIYSRQRETLLSVSIKQISLRPGGEYALESTPTSWRIALKFVLYSTYLQFLLLHVLLSCLWEILCTWTLYPRRCPAPIQTSCINHHTEIN